MQAKNQTNDMKKNRDHHFKFSTVKRSLRYMGKKKWLLVLIFVLTIGRSVGTLANNWILRPIIGSLMDGKGLEDLAHYVVLVSGIFVFSVIANYLSRRVVMKLNQDTVFELRRDVFNHMQILPVAFFDSTKHGDLMSVLTNDIDNIDVALRTSVSTIMFQSVIFLGSLVAMLLLSPLLALLVVMLMLINFTLVRTITKRSVKYYRLRQTAISELNSFAEERLTGQKVIKVFNYEDEAIDAFDKTNESLRHSGSRANLFSIILFPIMNNFTFIQFAIIAIIGSYMAITPGLPMDIATLAAFLQFSRIFSRPLIMIASEINFLIAALAGAERVFTILDQEPEIYDGDVYCETGDDGTMYWKSKTDRDLLVPVKGDLRLNHVTFGYLPDTPVLHDISLYAKPGQRIAFVGSTGAGKTTITNLITRFYDIDEGEILYDGIDIRTIDKRDLRRCIGMVLQDVRLFRGTVADNIRYGKTDATDDEVRQAAEIAGAHRFIEQLPAGYDTMLSPDGANLSEGQRQLLSIARAAIRNPVILILDEATSSVDTRTEKNINEGMNRLMVGRTVLAIAHRLSTVRTSNAIMVLEHGRIEERGTHADLMKEKGLYYKLNTGRLTLQ